jgi:hypothetical protein
MLHKWLSAGMILVSTVWGLIMGMINQMLIMIMIMINSCTSWIYSRLVASEVLAKQIPYVSCLYFVAK